MRKLFLATLLFLSSSLFAQVKTVPDAATFLCTTALNRRPFDYRAFFSPRFINAVPEQQLHGIIDEIVDAIGKCDHAEAAEPNGTHSVYKFVSASTRYVALAFSLDSNSLIDSLRLQDVVFPDIVIDSWNAARSFAHTLPGHSSFTVSNFAKNTYVEKDGEEFEPLGSEFKLYVLGALTDLIQSGSLKWEQTFPIRADWKSLPSGEMQNWPDGQEVPLKTFAEYMIKISDNTATDHLLQIVGRMNVEAQLSKMKSHFANLNCPFLMTSEIFKLKWAAPLDVINSYIHGDEATRRSLLGREVAALSLNKVGTNGVPFDQPAYIRNIEWFGSTKDICSSMKTLKEKNSPEVLDILSKNTPLIHLGADSHWAYAGYKGGSEPGVITMTFLLRNKNDEWGCISTAWNNENKNVSELVFSDFVSKVLKLAESYL